jgi:two-component system OmpR family response regulator
MAEATAYDAIVLDLMLPGIDGFETCRRLRRNGVRTPILMLTARDAVEDRVAGLDTGADDYVAKPFDFGELLARLRALVRRGPPERGPVLLEVFMRHPGEVLSRYQLLEGAWDSGYEHRSNVIDVYVRYLREKLDRPFAVRTIETVRGAGYRLIAP